MTDTITGTITTGITIDAGQGYSSPLTIASGGIVSGATAVTASYAATLQVYGTLTGSDAGAGIGVAFQSGGAITNAATGTIDADGTAVQFAGAYGTLYNAGLIGPGATTGIAFSAGGTVSNAAGAVISGYSIAILGDSGGGAVTVDNAGRIETRVPEVFSYGLPYTAGIYLRDGGSITNESTGTIAAYTGIKARGDSTIANSGTIAAYNTGIYLRAGGSITNAAGAVISAVRNNGLYLGYTAAATVDNAGTILAGSYNAGGDLVGGDSAIRLGGGGVVINETGGRIVSGGVFAIDGGYHPGTVDNFGTIIGGTTYGAGVSATGIALFGGGTITNEAGGLIIGYAHAIATQGGNTDSVANFGTIIGGQGQDDSAIAMRNGGTLTNGAGASITGAAAGVYLGQGGAVSNAATGTIDAAGTAVQFAGGYGTLYNAGLIGPGATTGIEFAAGGSVSNAAGAVISGYSIAIAGDAGGGVTVDNAGLIETRVPQVFSYGLPYSAGIYLRSGGSITNENTGTIAAYTGIKAGVASTVANSGTIAAYSTGVDLAGGSTLSNAAGAVISAHRNDGLYLGYSGAATVDNAGTILSGYTGSGGYLTFGDSAIHLGGGGMVTNQASGTIIAAEAFGIYGGYRAATIDNFGAIIGGTSYGGGVGGTGIALFGGGTITNEAGGTIIGYYHAITTAGGSTDSVANAGTIIGGQGLGDSAVSMRYGGTLTNSLGGTITGATDGVHLGDAGSVGNAGQITGSGGAGVLLGYGGTLSNAAGGVIAGSRRGVEAEHNAGTIANAGTIIATDTTAVAGTTVAGVYLGAGGTVTNAATALISGLWQGVYVSAATGTVDNAGTIIATEVSASPSGGVVVGVYLGQGGAVTNQAGGLISGYSGGIYIGGAAGTVANAGTIGDADTGTGVLLQAGGEVTNQAGGGIIAVGGGVVLTMGGSVSNAAGGTISAGYFGVYSHGGPGTVVNEGWIAGTDSAASSGVYLGAGGMVSNTIGATITGGSAGVLLAGTTGIGALVVNAGTITGGDGSLAGVGLSVVGGDLSVTNTADGVISGDLEGILGLSGGADTIDNAGLIAATTTLPGAHQPVAGVFLFGDALVTNHAGGTISGTDIGVFVSGYSATVLNDGVIAGASRYGVALSAADSTVVNTGSLSGGIAGVSLGYGGMLSNASAASITGILASGAAATIVNAGAVTTGAIYGYDTATGTGYTLSGHGIALYGGGSITNLAGASITGAVDGIITGGTDATVENAGTVVGGTRAVYLNAQNNRLIIDPGAVFVGVVLADTTTAANVLELASGASAGTLNGLGTAYIGFQQVTIDAGAAWTIVATETGMAASTIAGFDGDDRLELTDLAYNAGNTANIDDTTDILTISDSLGTVLDTVQLAGDFAGKFFHIGDAGANGSYLTEDGTPCYCRGTLVRTGSGEVAVENLRIGDLLLTLSGQLRPLRWIGRRSYSGRFAAGNRAVLPVRFSAGSLADGVPARDLLVSPLHAMFLDGMLIPAEALVNGAGIVQLETVAQVDYYHLELDSHDIILAEGAPSETFIDDDSRGMFHNAAEHRALYPDAAPAPARYCAPRVEDGEALEAVRRRLLARAAPPAVPSRVHGHLDVASRGHIAGWARDAAAPQTPVRLRILANGVTLAEITADRPRPDLRRAGFGDGRHGFSLAIPDGLPPAERHLIQVALADGLPLPNWSRVIEPEAAPPMATASPMRGHIEQVSRELIAGWVCNPDDGATPQALQILDNGVVLARVLANRQRADLAAAGIGDGRHGFQFRPPGGLSPLTRHVIAIRREADGRELPGSPAIIEPATAFSGALAQAVERAVAALQGTDAQAPALSFLQAQADRLAQQHADTRNDRPARLAWRDRHARPAPDPGRHALVIDERVPEPGRDAGSQAILSHMQALRALGYTVSFVAAEQMAPGEAAIAALAAAGITCCARPFYASVEDVLRRHADGLDLVYLHRAEIAARYLALSRRYSPQARVVYSVADLHHLRLARQAVVEERPELLAASRRLRLAEYSAAWSADAVITHSPAEAALLAQAVPPARVHVVPWAVPARPVATPFAARDGVAFIGGYGHAPNVDAARYLVETVMPLVWRADPAIPCILAGSAMPEVVRRLAGPRVRIAGQVPELAALFAQIRLTVAPLRYGAGVNGKVLDSLAAGIPCVLSEIAAEGLALPGAMIGRDAAALAAHILRAHREEATQAIAAGLEFLASHHTPAIVAQRLHAAIQGKAAKIAAA